MSPNIALIFALVLVAHLWGDFIFQTDWQAANKMKPGWEGWKANIAHVWCYTFALSIPGAWLFTNSAYAAGYWKYLVLLGFSAVSHAFIDRRWPVYWLMEKTGSKNFSKTEWGVVVTDQVLHISILFITIAVLWGR